MLANPDVARGEEPGAKGRRELLAALVVLLASCGGGGGDPGPIHGEGEIGTKTDGSLFIADAHRGGNARQLHLAEIAWGRLVDVHDVDATGQPSVRPLFEDLVVNEIVVSDSIDYELSTNPITQEVRLVIARTRGEPDDGSGTFESLLHRATSALPVIVPKGDAGTSAPPFSFVARNAALLVRFDDLLDDGDAARDRLTETVRVLTSYPPRIPFTARILFDRNHGGLSGTEFHSTRVLVDLTVSETEASQHPTSLPLNSLGLPQSFDSSTDPNAALRFPTRRHVPSGQFALLSNLSGGTLAEAGPLDTTVPTRDLVRAMRAGNPADANGGFLLDVDRPKIVGQWPLTVELAQEDPSGADIDYLLDIVFDSVCRAAPAVGDVIDSGGRLLEVLEEAGAPDANGRVAGVRARLLGGETGVGPDALLGRGQVLVPLNSPLPSNVLPFGCWLRFVPPALQPPVGGVKRHAEISVRFSEPMDPLSFGAFDTFRVLRGSSGSSGHLFAKDIVVATVGGSADLKEFTLDPLLPLSNDPARDYRFELVSGESGLRDIGGNPLAVGLEILDFELDPSEPPQRTAGFALRFSDDELPPDGAPDLRGQFTADPQRGVILPRMAAVGTAPTDRGNALQSMMLPFPAGVQTPLSPLGSKLQAIWRYVDFDWRAADETYHNIDVTRLWWSPANGRVVADFFPNFEMRLAHGRKLPDETSGFNGPVYPESGLVGGPLPFTDNVLVDPRSPVKIVHSRSLGYRIDPSDLALNSHGAYLMPWPWKAEDETDSFTWRDTAAIAKGGGAGPGVPLDIEVGGLLFVESTIGSIAGPADIPSFALPLLWEIRCYPTTTGIGLNAFDISIAVVNRFPQPNFRAFSTGGIDVAGNLVTKNPDLEVAPTGGFNPNGSPPGSPTFLSADNSYYMGQLDYVIRVSRAHTVWIDTEVVAPHYADPVIEPQDQPPGTRILLEFRGADTFLGAGLAPFDGSVLDPYGNFETGTTVYHGGVDGWTDDIQRVDGARYLQVRFSFFNDVDTRLSPMLSSLGVAFSD